jgi:hypothetical protein
MAMIHLKKVQIVGLKKFFWAVYSPLDGRAGAHRLAKGLLADGPSSFSAGLRLMRAAVLALVAVLSLSSSPVRALLSASLKSVESIGCQSSCKSIIEYMQNVSVQPNILRNSHIWRLWLNNYLAGTKEVFPPSQNASSQAVQKREALCVPQPTKSPNLMTLHAASQRKPSLTVVEITKPLEVKQNTACERGRLSSDGNTDGKSSLIQDPSYDSVSSGDSISTTDSMQVMVNPFLVNVEDLSVRIDGVPEEDESFEKTCINRAYQIITVNYLDLESCLHQGLDRNPKSKFFAAILAVVRPMNKGQIIPNADLDELENVMNLCKSDSKEGVTISLILNSAIYYNYELLGNNL